MEKTLNVNLSVGTKIGYSIGTVTDAITYDWVTCFFIYFLTDFAEISPAFAGMIIMLSILWDAITDPIIGTLSDNSKSKYGRRRPFIIGSAVPLSLSMALMFIYVPFEGALANAYYLIMAIIFWTGYTAFNVPYYSLGVSLSYDENERTSIRSYSTAFMYIGAICATFLPMYMIGMLEDRGMEEGAAWSLVAAVLAGVALITTYICWRTTRGKEIMADEEREKFQYREIFKVLKPKSIRIIFLISFTFYLFYTMSNSSVMYFIESKLGMGESEASLLYLTNGVVGIFVAIGLSKLSYKFDKKNVFLGAAVISAIGQILAKFIGIDSLADACVLEVITTVGMGAFWLFTYAFLYDASEIEEFRSGERREGVLNAYQSFIMKLGAAIGAFIVGLLLEASGYVGELEEFIPQTPETIDAIENIFTIYPGVIMLVCALFIYMLPITKKRYAALLENLELKRAGKEYSTEGFEELLK